MGGQQQVVSQRQVEGHQHVGVFPLQQSATAMTFRLGGPKEICHLKTAICIDCSSTSPTWSFVPADELLPLTFKELPICILSVEGTG